MTQRVCPLLTAIILFGVSAPCWAEVSDKIPTQTELWLQGCVVSALIFAGLLWNRWLNIVAIPIAVLSIYAALGSHLFWGLGESIVQEQGCIYLASLYGSKSLPVAACVIGNFARQKRKKK